MEELIESIRKYPSLWKIDSKDYKNNEIKEAAWRKVDEECELTDVKEAKVLWKKLRDGHRQALNKRKTTTGQAANNDTKPWKYEKQMDFLVPHLTNRPRSTNAFHSNDGGTNATDTEQVTENAEEIEENSELPTVQQNTTNQPLQPDTTNQQSQQTPSQVKRKTDKITAYLEQEQKRREQRSINRDLFRREILSRENNVKPTQDAALKKFFDSMHDETNKLSDYLQIKVQRQIFNSVMEAREEQLSNKRLCQQYTQSMPLPCSSLATDSSISYSNVHSPNSLPSLSRPSSSNAQWPQHNITSPEPQEHDNEDLRSYLSNDTTYHDM